MRPRGHLQALPPRPAAHPREGLRDPRQPRGGQRGPLRPDPFTHNHRRHPINDSDQQPVHERDFDAEPVTLTELVEAWQDNNGAGAFAHWKWLYHNATADLRLGANAVSDALETVREYQEHIDGTLADLSPEERAEFDRRTSG